MTTEPRDSAPKPEAAPNTGERFRAWGREHPYKFGGTLFGAGLILVILIVIALVDWKGLIEGAASAALGRKVAINGDWHVHLSFSPTLVADQVTIANPSDWQGDNPPGDMADIGEITLQIKFWPLLAGRADIPQLILATPKIDLERRADGAANWTMASSNKPTHFPLIRNLTITGGALHIADAKRKLVFDGSLDSHETRGDAEPFFIEGKGALNREPFLLQVRGDSLLSVSPDTPYNFTAMMHAGATKIDATGKVERPFDFGVFDTSLKVSGNDLADLYYFTGVAFPNTPAYNLSGQLHRDGQKYEIKKLAGKVGNSDLSGTFAVDDSGKRPDVTANLESKNLDFNDLGALLGGDRAGRTVSNAAPAKTAEPSTISQIENIARNAANQKTAPPAPTSGARLLPDAPLQVSRVRDMDAKVTYRADSVKAVDIPLTEVSLTLNLKDGVMNLDPLSFRLRQGKLAGAVKIDARADKPVVDLDMKLTDAQLDQFFVAKAGGEPSLTGSILARAKLHGTGLSVHEAAGDADGNVTLVVPHGEIRKAFAELMGIDVATGLGLLMSGDQTKADMRCAVADFHARNGELIADNILIDTDVVMATGGGDVNLKSEAVNLSLEGHPKKLRLLHLMAPITVTGTLSSPKVGVNAGKAVAQAGVAVALGALLTPLASILPFVDPGLAKDADCGALLASATPKAEAPPPRLARTGGSR
jgi:hypothetical protein